MIENYEGLLINFEYWQPNWRSPGEERIAIYKQGKNIKNYILEFGASDIIVDGENLLILSSYSEWPKGGGRHLQKISLKELIF